MWKMNKFKFNKRGQEEMIGFGLIIVIVAVILLIFISFVAFNKESGDVENYEIESFIQSMLQYTTECEDYLGYLSVQKLIYSCEKNEFCLNKENSCDVLENTLSGIVDSSWQIENRPIEAYELQIINNEKDMILINKGNKTNNYKSSMQILPKEVSIVFSAYY